MTDSAKTVEPGEATPVCVDPATQNSEPRRCNRQLRGKPGQFCKQFVVAGRNACRIHGGSSPIGNQHPSFTSGAYSRALPRSLRKDFLRYVNDPELISARTELGVLRCRLAALAGRLDTGESAGAWGKLRDQLVKVRAACDERDIDAVKAALAGVSEITESANNSEESWAAYETLAERFTVIAAREAKRLHDAGLVLSVEQAQAFAASLAAAVAKHADNRTRTLIAEEFKRLRLGNLDELAAVGSLVSDHGSSGDAGEVT